MSGADDTSCSYSFAFYMALCTHVLGTRQAAANPSTEYLFNALCESLATMCRMYNDYGSLARDSDEGNLNCIDFLNDQGGDIQKAKWELMRLAKFERGCMDLALLGLKASGVKGQALDALMLFIDVTDLFGQVYVVNDVETKTKLA
jgi:hypothetical protein